MLQIVLPGEGRHESQFMRVLNPTGSDPDAITFPRRQGNASPSSAAGAVRVIRPCGCSNALLEDPSIGLQNTR
ncbi:hypothetical protein Pd630_LPD17020 (plasmid) [Rhodococcus opacus PD630]|nr:hypothetical protein Pd630_LPD17020 [Rhodococcus opacus PD630]